jgi:hypothetical protein
VGALNPSKAGFVLGALLGGWHFLWALMVALGWAQAVLDFIFWIHFIKPIYIIAPFNAGLALILIVVTAAIGYAFGYVFGVLWNCVYL